jgi:microcystin degradation protein MlrC
MAHRAPVARPVIAIAGLGIESSTFSPARTLAPAFHPQRGEEILARYPFLAPGTQLREAAEWRGALPGKALPGGTVTAGAFAELADELIERLAEMPPLDGLWYDIHGAMTVEGIDDAEALLLGRIRETVGPDVVVATSMDLHGNVSRELVHRSDLITCYRMAPHEDYLDTKERALRNLLDLLVSGAPLPAKAWIPVPVLLAGEQTSTRIEPARGIYAAVPEVEAADGVIDAAIWVGYFTDLDLDPRSADVVVVKIGYLEPELFAMAADWRLALTPGGVDQDLTRLGHRRIQRPMFPFDPDMADPDLGARIIPPSHAPLPPRQ